MDPIAVGPKSPVDPNAVGKIPKILIGGSEERADLHAEVGLMVNRGGSFFDDVAGLSDVEADAFPVAFDYIDTMEKYDCGHFRSGL